MKTFAIPLWLIIFDLALIVAMLALSAVWVMKWLNRFFSDRLLLIDKDGRWKEYFRKFYGNETTRIGRQTYSLTPEAGLLNSWGRSLYIFFENNPTPLKIKGHKADWISSETLTAVMNNDIVRDIVTPKTPMDKLMMILAGIGGTIAGLASLVNLLIAIGVITP